MGNVLRGRDPFPPKESHSNGRKKFKSHLLHSSDSNVKPRNHQEVSGRESPVYDPNPPRCYEWSKLKTFPPSDPPLGPGAPPPQLPGQPNAGNGPSGAPTVYENVVMKVSGCVTTSGCVPPVGVFCSGCVPPVGVSCSGCVPTRSVSCLHILLLCDILVQSAAILQLLESVPQHALIHGRHLSIRLSVCLSSVTYLCLSVCLSSNCPPIKCLSICLCINPTANSSSPHQAAPTPCTC